MPATPQLGAPRRTPLPWAGRGGGDERLGWLAATGVIESGAMVETANSRRRWAMVSTHMPGRTGAECHDRWERLETHDPGAAADAWRRTGGAAWQAPKPRPARPVARCEKRGLDGGGGRAAPRPPAAARVRPAGDEGMINEVDGAAWAAAQVGTRAHPLGPALGPSPSPNPKPSPSPSLMPRESLRRVSASVPMARTAVAGDEESEVAAAVLWAL